MRQAVLQKLYAEINPLLILGEAGSVSSSCLAMSLSRLSLDKDGEHRRKLSDIERRRGDFDVRDCVKNPQP